MHGDIGQGVRLATREDEDTLTGVRVWRHPYPVVPVVGQQLAAISYSNRTWL